MLVLSQPDPCAREITARFERETADGQELGSMLIQKSCGVTIISVTSSALLPCDGAMTHVTLLMALHPSTSF